MRFRGRLFQRSRRYGTIIIWVKTLSTVAGADWYKIFFKVDIPCRTKSPMSLPEGTNQIEPNNSTGRSIKERETFWNISLSSVISSFVIIFPIFCFSSPRKYYCVLVSQSTFRFLSHINCPNFTY